MPGHYINIPYVNIPYINIPYVNIPYVSIPYATIPNVRILKLIRIPNKYTNLEPNPEAKIGIPKLS